MRGQSSKRCRVEATVGSPHRPSTGVGVLCSVASSDHRRVERWCGVSGLTEELRVCLDHGQSSDDESRIAGQQAESKKSLEDVLRITTAALQFRGQPGDCFEPMGAISAVTCRIMITYGAYRVAHGSTYLVLDDASCGGLIKVASLRCAAATLLLRICGQPQFGHMHHSSVQVALCGVNGFGWYDGMNSAPAVAEASKRLIGDASSSVVLLWDSMLTDAGAPSIAKAVRCVHVGTHHRYGVGISALGGVQLCATLVSDGVVAHALLLPPCGPLVVHCHLPSHSMPSADELRRLHVWLLRCCEAPMACLLVVSGMHVAASSIAAPAGFVLQDRIGQGVDGGDVWCRGGHVSLLHSETLYATVPDALPSRSRSPLQDPDTEQTAGAAGISTLMFHCGLS